MSFSGKSVVCLALGAGCLAQRIGGEACLGETLARCQSLCQSLVPVASLVPGVVVRLERLGEPWSWKTRLPCPQVEDRQCSPAQKCGQR